MLRFLFNIIYPKFCAGCDVRGSYLCEKCLHDLKKKKKQSCPHCRKENCDGKFCNQYCHRQYNFERLITCSGYEKDDPLRKLLLLFKYRYVEEINKILGKIMKYQFAYFSHEFDSALIVPMAIDKRREKLRGFNQTGLLSKFLAGNFPKMEFYDCLRRNSLVKKQSELGVAERRINLRGAFSIPPECREKLNGQTIILVDDVATTCSTLNEAGKILKLNGAKSVCGLVLARGHLFGKS
ncbi:ComF family protein [Candidatus Peregrinibacteria bacterium]|nr:ComF family protein [Candidatus Peregrinibacteria bacterium]